MAGKYAEGTEVTPENSRAEIERTILRYGAESFVSGYDKERAMVMFVHSERRVRFVIEVPNWEDPEYARDGNGVTRNTDRRKTAADKEHRRRWRALLLAIKAKLEVVESGIATFEEEFAAHIVLPDGSTVADYLVPAIQAAYETGSMPDLFPAMPRALGPASS